MEDPQYAAIGRMNWVLWLCKMTMVISDGPFAYIQYVSRWSIVFEVLLNFVCAFSARVERKFG